MKEKIVIDAENAVLGRLASYAAKQLLLGKEVIIVNSEKAIIIGNEKDILEKYKKKRARGKGSQKGPFFPSEPEKILKRAVRGMLSYKKGKSREVFKILRCYVSMPQEYAGKKMIKAGRGKQGMSLEKLSKMLRGGK